MVRVELPAHLRTLAGVAREVSLDVPAGDRQVCDQSAPQRGRPTAYVCVDYACRLPTTDREAFAAQLDERASTPGER